MYNFNNLTYQALVTDLLNNAFYVEDVSNRGKIAQIRQYAEVIIRRILDYPSDRKLTLGNIEIVKKLDRISNSNKLLLDSIGNICEIGNKCTHTQETGGNFG